MIEARGVSIRYGQAPPVLAGIDLELRPGEQVRLLGRSGAGKTSLVLALAGLLSPAAGTVEVDGCPTSQRSSRRHIASRVGLLFQNPETQLLTSRVADEVALGLRNLGWPLARIAERVAHLLDALGLEPLAHRSPRALSAGEMQRVALAAALAPEPRYLFLDEPNAYLDPDSAAEVEGAIADATSAGRALRLDISPLLPPLSTRATGGRLIVVENGGVVHDGGWPLPPDLAGRLLGADGPGEPEPLGILSPRPATTLRARGLAGGWGGEAGGWGGNAGSRVLRVFHDVDLELRPGTVTHVGGRSGAGKSTLLATLGGLIPPLAGQVEVEPRATLGSRVASVFQLAERLFYRPTVKEELLEFAGAGSSAGGGAGAAGLALEPALAFVGLPEGTGERPPLRLSSGELRRLALAAGLISRRPVLLLDEPGAGLDGPGRRMLVHLVRSFAAEGGTVLVAGHDPELADLADEGWVMAAGRLEPGRSI